MELAIKIQSIIKNIGQVEFFFNSLFKEFRFSRKTYCRIYLSCTEAVNNAIIHGNKANSERFVKISFEDKPSFFLVKIEDEGLGFDYNMVPDPRIPANIGKESGRGIFIMKEYADKVIFENNGASVLLIFNK